MTIPELQDPLLTGESVTPVPSPSLPEPMAMQMEGVENNDDNNNNEPTVAWEKGEVQTLEYRDKWFGLLFVLQFAVVTLVACFVGMPELAKTRKDVQDAIGDDDAVNGLLNEGVRTVVMGLLVLLVPTALAAVVISALALLWMHRYAVSFVRVAFIVSPVVFGMIALFLLAVDDPVANAFACLWFLLATFSVLYAWCYWKHIPFASANLRTGLVAVGTHQRVVTVSFGMVLLAAIFSILWSLAAFGVFATAPPSCSDDDNNNNNNNNNNAINGNDDDQDVQCSDIVNLYYILLLLSYYWTHYTFEGIVRVTVSGTVGTWWFEAPTLTRTVGHNTVGDALTRATTYSFGSVCLGSLIVAVVQTLKQLVRNQRRRGGGGGGGMLLCVLECLLACLRNLLEFINDWAYVYIGLYGYGFVDAAKNVFQLFQSRGWTTLITNALVVRTLNLVMMLVAAATGFVSMAVVRVVWGEWSAVFYPIGVVLGFFVSSIVMVVIDGAVKTSIVCFAEAPQELAANHPELYNNMMTAYMERYPTIFANVVRRDTTGPLGVAELGDVPTATPVPSSSPSS